MSRIRTTTEHDCEYRSIVTNNNQKEANVNYIEHVQMTTNGCTITSREQSIISYLLEQLTQPECNTRYDMSQDTTIHVTISIQSLCQHLSRNDDKLLWYSSA